MVILVNGNRTGFPMSPARFGQGPVANFQFQRIEPPQSVRWRTGRYLVVLRAQGLRLRSLRPRWRKWLPRARSQKVVLTP